MVPRQRATRCPKHGDVGSWYVPSRGWRLGRWSHRQHRRCWVDAYRWTRRGSFQIAFTQRWLGSGPPPHRSARSATPVSKESGTHIGGCEREQHARVAARTQCVGPGRRISASRRKEWSPTANRSGMSRYWALTQYRSSSEGTRQDCSFVSQSFTFCEILSGYFS